MTDGSDKVIQTQVDVQVIKAGQIETNRRLSNIEKKMDAFAFVKQPDFDAFRLHVEDKFMTKEDFAPFKWVIITFGGAFLTALAIAGANFLIRGGLK